MRPSELRDRLDQVERLLEMLEALAAGQAADRFEHARARLELLDNQVGGLAWIVQDDLVAADGRRRDEEERRRCDGSSSRRSWRRAS